METSNKRLNKNQQFFSEEDLMAQARDVFGKIPVWYQKNKGFIEKTRCEIEEENAEFSKKLQRHLKNLHDILSKTAPAQKPGADK